MAIKDVGVRLVVENLGGFERSMGRYNSAIERAESRTNKFAERAGKAGRAMVALGAPIVAFAAIAVKAAVDFDTALVGVGKTTNATEAELEQLGRQFRAMALDIPVAAKDLANIGEIAGRLGIQTPQIAAFTQNIAALGAATDLTNEASAEFVARIQAITGLPANEVQSFASALVELGNNLATSESQIAAFALRMAGAGDVAGLTQAEILGIAGSFSELGVRAERGGTAVQKVLFTMIDAINTAGPELETFATTAGITAEEFAILFEKDAGEAFTRFVEGLGRSGDEAFAVLTQLGLADQRLAQSFITLANAGGNLRENIELSNAAFAENTALIEEAERRYASAASQFILFKNNVTELAITVGQILLPPLLTLSKILIPVIQRMAEFAEKHPTLTKLVVLASLALVGLGTALIAIGFIAPGVVAALALFKLLIPIFTGLSISMGPITLIVLGISAAIAAGIIIWKNWDTIMGFIKDRVNTVIDVINKLINLMFKLNPLLLGLDVLGILSADDVQIPSFAHGGTMRRAGAALVGERGPEIVALPAGANVSPVGPTNNINVTANYTNPQEPNSLRSDMEFIAMTVMS